jgi:hypothetical protein
LEQKIANFAERDPSRTESRSTARSPTRKSERADEHLLATVRGLQSELVSKEKELQRITRELNEAKNSVNKLRQGRHVDHNKNTGGNNFVIIELVFKIHKV